MKTLEAWAAALFKMDEATWLRHANPWSVWTRNSVLPLLIVSLWSRTWIGWWAIAPLALALLWTWYNPRIFSAPASTDTWASKATFGERLWLQRKSLQIPQKHRWAPLILNLVAATGIAFVSWGVIALAIWPVLFGSALVYAGKLWFLDRMVWLYEDMRIITPEAKDWVYTNKQ